MHARAHKYNHQVACGGAWWSVSLLSWHPLVAPRATLPLLMREPTHASSHSLLTSTTIGSCVMAGFIDMVVCVCSMPSRVSTLNTLFSPSKNMATKSMPAGHQQVSENGHQARRGGLHQAVAGQAERARCHCLPAMLTSEWPLHEEGRQEVHLLSLWTTKHESRATVLL